MNDLSGIAALDRREAVTITPSILYVGTPVVLVTSVGEDGSVNISPMSSAWALGDRVVLGFEASSQGLANLQRTGECALSFPDADLWENVERIARATGRTPVPDHKRAMGYEYVPDKFALGGFTAVASETIAPPRVAQCPLQFEAKLVHARGSQSHTIGVLRDFSIVEVRVTRVHAHRGIVVDGTNHVDTARWNPLLYVFRHYFGTGPERGKTFRAAS